MSATAPGMRRPDRVPAGMAVIDCDVHVTPSAPEVLFPYLPAYWREVLSTTQFRGPTDTAYPQGAATSLRPELMEPDGARPGTSLEQLQRQLLDPWDVEAAVLTPFYGVESVHNPDAAAALASAMNDWQRSACLDRDPRLRGSVVVPSALPTLAAAEIDRVGSDPRFVQVLLPVRSLMPYGNRNHLPTFDAAVRNGLAVALHFGGASGLPPTSTGWPTRYIEEYVDMAGVFQSQLMNLIAEGVFDRHPDLRMVLIESGFAWLPAFLWRFDRLWRGLHREIPWTQRPPSQVVREQVRITLQPVDGPPEPGALARLLDLLGCDELLLFSTDYPHRHVDEPEQLIPEGIGDELLAGILAENARRFYGLGGATDG